MATKDKGKKRILEKEVLKDKTSVTKNSKKRILDNQITFEFFGELDTEIKPIKKKQEKVKKVEIKKEKKPKAIKFNHIKKNRKVKRRYNG